MAVPLCQSQTLFQQSELIIEVLGSWALQIHPLPLPESETSKQTPLPSFSNTHAANRVMPNEIHRGNFFPANTGNQHSALFVFGIKLSAEWSSFGVMWTTKELLNVRWKVHPFHLTQEKQTEASWVQTDHPSFRNSTTNVGRGDVDNRSDIISPDPPQWCLSIVGLPRKQRRLLVDRKTKPSGRLCTLLRQTAPVSLHLILSPKWEG